MLNGTALFYELTLGLNESLDCFTPSELVT